MAADEPQDALRLDKWLWHARFFKTRAIAQLRISAGVVRLNSQRVEKSGARVRIGDVLTLIVGKAVKVVKVRAFGTWRGPPNEAQDLYEVLEDA